MRSMNPEPRRSSAPGPLGSGSRFQRVRNDELTGVILAKSQGAGAPDGAAGDRACAFSIAQTSQMEIS